MHWYPSVMTVSLGGSTTVSRAGSTGALLSLQYIVVATLVP